MPRPVTSPFEGRTPPWAPGASLEGWTLPALLAARARLEPGRPALGAWAPDGVTVLTWAELAGQVRDVALGLRELGVGAGDRVAIMGDPSAEYVVAEHAAWLAGSISLGIYPTSSPPEIAYQLEDSGAAVVFVQAGEHHSRLNEAVGRLDSSPKVVVIGDGTPSFASLRRRGGELPGALDDLAAARSPEDGLCIIYTSGTTGPPKGVLHTHRSFLYANDGLVHPALPELRLADQRVVGHLPLAHVVGKLLTITLPLVSRVVPYVTAETRDPVAAFRAIGPTYVLQPPRFLTRTATRILTAADDSGRARRAAYAAAMRIGRGVVDRRWRRREPSLPLRLAWHAARRLVFRPLLRGQGYHDVRWIQTGSALVPAELAALWQAWGVDVRIVYGLSESAGHVTAQQRPFPEPVDVGEPLRRPEFELQLADDGEILFRSPSVFSGYWGKPDATAETLVDGWLRTGDVGEWTPEGALRLIDRKKDIVITSGGKSLSPLQIENALKGSPYIAEAVVVAEGRKYVAALIEVDHERVAEADGAAVTELIAAEVERANEGLGRVEQVKRFALLPRRLEDEPGLLTPTRKVRRRQVEERFADLVATLYDAEPAIGAQVRGLVRREGD